LCQYWPRDAVCAARSAGYKSGDCTMEVPLVPAGDSRGTIDYTVVAQTVK
jgi:hypothetical protein